MAVYVAGRDRWAPRVIDQLKLVIFTSAVGTEHVHGPSARRTVTRSAAVALSASHTHYRVMPSPVLASTAATVLPVLASSVLLPPSPVPESAAGCRGRSGCLAGHLRAQLVSMERGSDVIIRRLS